MFLCHHSPPVKFYLTVDIEAALTADQPQVKAQVNVSQVSVFLPNKGFNLFMSVGYTIHTGPYVFRLISVCFVEFLTSGWSL